MDAPPSSAAARVVPGWLKALGIIGIIVGAFGIASGISTLRQRGVSPEQAEQETERVMQQVPWMRSPSREVQTALKESAPGIVAVDRRWRNRRVGLAAANLLLSALLLAGAFQGTRLVAGGRWLWLNAALALIPIEVLAAVMQSLWIRDVMAVWVAALAHAGGVPHAAEPFGVGRLVVGLAALIVGLKAAALVGYYVTTVVLLNRPAARALFAPPAAPGARPSGPA